MFILLGNHLAPTLRDYFQSRVRNDQNITLLPGNIGKFVSSEAFSDIKAAPADLGGKPVTIVQSLAAVDDHTANDLAMQLLLTVRILKKNGAGPVWAIMPFAAYGRQDRPRNGQLSSSIDDFAFLLKQAGVEGVTTMELHSELGVQFLKNNFGKKQVFNLDPTKLFVRDIKACAADASFVVGGPDAGANARADSVAKALKAKKFTFTKEHIGVNNTSVTGFSGDVKEAATITVDDMIDTGGTIKNAQLTLQSNGAVSRYVYSAHGILSNGGLEKLFEAAANDGSSSITRLVLTDTIDFTAKMDQLKSRYGAEAVDARIRVLETGETFYNHMLRDILPHPVMKAY